MSVASATPEASPRPDSRCSQRSISDSERASGSPRRSRLSSARPRSEMVCSSSPKNEVFIAAASQPKRTSPLLARAHHMIRQPCGDLGEYTQDYDRQHHTEDIGQRAPHHFDERYVRSDGIDDIDVEADRRVNQADLHIDGQDYAEPDRVEAGGRDDWQQNRRGHQDD